MKKYYVILVSVFYLTCIASFHSQTEGMMVFPESDCFLKWKFQTSDHVLMTPTLIDLEGDGFKEVLFGSYDHIVYCLNHEWKNTRFLLIFETGIWERDSIRWQGSYRSIRLTDKGLEIK